MVFFYSRNSLQRPVNTHSVLQASAGSWVFLSNSTSIYICIVNVIHKTANTIRWLIYTSPVSLINLHFCQFRIISTGINQLQWNIKGDRVTRSKHITNEVSQKTINLYQTPTLWEYSTPVTPTNKLFHYHWTCSTSDKTLACIGKASCRTRKQTIPVYFIQWKNIQA